MSAPEGSSTGSAWESFRDPDGSLSHREDSSVVIRRLTPSGRLKSLQLETLPSLKALQQRDVWVKAQRDAADPGVLFHPKVFFPSYPHEWSPAMLHRAASITLEAGLALLEDDWELKDATPANVLFEGTRPVFVDHMSPVPRGEGQVGWRAYGQFTRTFLIPLLLGKARNIPLAWSFLSRRDGVPPEVALPMLGWSQACRPLAFNLVTAPAWFTRRSLLTTRPHTGVSLSPEVSAEVTRRILLGLKRRLGHLTPNRVNTGPWSAYQDEGISYSKRALEAKSEFILRALRTLRSVTTLDLGCNTGKFSIMAAKTGARVVALDSDQGCVERLFLESEQAGLDIQPLVSDLGRPSPRLGWGGHEALSLQDRLKGRFEMTLSLAIVHHLLIRERIPLPNIFEFIADTTNRFAILEWVPPTDPQFIQLAGENHSLYRDLSLDGVIPQLTRHFRVIDRMDLPESERVLMLLER